METFRRCLDFNLSCCKYLNELVDVQNPNHCEFYPLDVLASVEENKSLWPWIFCQKCEYSTSECSVIMSVRRFMVDSFDVRHVANILCDIKPYKILGKKNMNESK